MPIMTAPIEKHIAPPSAPLLQAAPQPDDIPDPVVPAEVIASKTAQNAPESTHTPGATSGTPKKSEETAAPIEPQALGFLQWIQQQLRSTFDLEILYANMRRDEQFSTMKTWLEAQASPAALAALDTQSLNGPPYQASVQAISPDGFAVTITVTKRDTGALVEDLNNLLPWLKAQGYRAS